MKKIFWGGIAILAIAAAIAFNVNLGKQSNGLSDISLANVEALANPEDGGTSVGYCTKAAYPGTGAWKKYCDSRTSGSAIYPCPPGDSWGYYDESQCQDRCTK